MSTLRPVHVVVGDAAVLVDREVARIEAEALPGCGLPAFNHATFRLGDVSGEEALSVARTVPMMADRRLVVVRDLQEGTDAFFEALLDYLGEPAPSTVLLLTGTGFPPVRKGGRNWASRVGNAIKKVGDLRKLDATTVSPVRTAQDTATALGKRLDVQDAELLVEIVGRDLDRIVREVEKLALYVGDAEIIDGEAVHQASSQVAEAVAWDLTAGLAAQDTDLALAALHRLLEGSGATGDDQPHKLLGLVGWQLREILQLAELVRLGTPEAEIRRRIRMRDPVYRRVRRALGPRFPGAADVLERLATANRAMNSSRAGDRRVLEELVVGLCHLSR